MAKISVIIPTYNQAEYLTSCLDAVWFQEHPDLEIIVVNDGSSDQTSQVLSAFQSAIIHEETSFASYYNLNTNEICREHHSRYFPSGRSLAIINQKENKGLAHTINIGLKASTGKYCTYVPSDNICYPSMFTELEAALKRHDADFAYADMFIIDDAHNIIRKFELPDYSFQRCFCDWYLCGVCKLYKTALHELQGYYDEALLAHDHELFLRFAENGYKFVHVPKVLMGVRSHDHEREVGIHAPENWQRLLQESKDLVLRARKVKTHSLNNV